MEAMTLGVFIANGLPLLIQHEPHEQTLQKHVY